MDNISERNHFALLGLPVRFEIDMEALSAAYRSAQLAVHPDRSSAEGRIRAQQWSSQINQAYRLLKDPLERALYLLQLQGIHLQSERSISHSKDFLIRQMEWHEEYETAQTEGSQALVQFSASLESTWLGLQQQMEKQFAVNDIPAVQDTVCSLLFLRRLREQLADDTFSPLPL